MFREKTVLIWRLWRSICEPEILPIRLQHGHACVIRLRKSEDHLIGYILDASGKPLLIRTEEQHREIVRSVHNDCHLVLHLIEKGNGPADPPHLNGPVLILVHCSVDWARSHRNVPLIEQMRDDVPMAQTGFRVSKRNARTGEHWSEDTPFCVNSPSPVGCSRPHGNKSEAAMSNQQPFCRILPSMKAFALGTSNSSRCSMIIGMLGCFFTRRWK
ncbi:hypothetical protein SAMN04515647_0385 [Cohaesibacter sp. ES.047]|nr:hypothetical protein SAMN04515647_0385 [Cohaesibacter sp. ES.047]